LFSNKFQVQTRFKLWPRIRRLHPQLSSQITNTTKNWNHLWVNTSNNYMNIKKSYFVSLNWEIFFEKANCIQNVEPFLVAIAKKVLLKFEKIQILKDRKTIWRIPIENERFLWHLFNRVKTIYLVAKKFCRFRYSLRFNKNCNRKVQSKLFFHTKNGKAFIFPFKAARRIRKHQKTNLSFHLIANQALKIPLH